MTNDGQSVLGEGPVCGPQGDSAPSPAIKSLRGRAQVLRLGLLGPLGT